MPYYLPIAGGRIIGFIPFPRVLVLLGYVNCNQSRPGFELVSPCPFPTTITITPRAPPWIGTLYFPVFQNCSIAVRCSLVLYTGHSLRRMGFLHLYWDAVGVFYNSNRLSYHQMRINSCNRIFSFDECLFSSKIHKI